MLIMRITMNQNTATVWRYGRFENPTYTLTKASHDRLVRVLSESPFYCRLFGDCVEWNRVEVWESGDSWWSNTPSGDIA